MGIETALLGGSLLLTGASAGMQYRASRQAAKVDAATAAYNAKVDEAEAKQLELDTAQNIISQRAENAVYLSQQEASYAAAGVLADTGSPLAAQITNVGRLEQRIQQEHVSSIQKQQQLYSAAKAGVASGRARAYADKMAGNLALVDGGARLAGLAFQGFNSGTFGSKAPKITNAGPIGLTG